MGELFGFSWTDFLGGVSATGFLGDGSDDGFLGDFLGDGSLLAEFVVVANVLFPGVSLVTLVAKGSIVSCRCSWGGNSDKSSSFVGRTEADDTRECVISGAGDCSYCLFG
jgi:hypothetical protein